jgi:prepilin-type N-terminal cleavage/methylation domain-containing protein
MLTINNCTRVMHKHLSRHIPHRRAAVRRNGFTLVEILMVVVILGIVASIVMPQLGSRDDLKLAAAARVVMADLAYAQSRAISTQARQYVLLSNNSYTLKAMNAANTLAAIAHPINPGNYSVTFDTGPLRGVAIASTSFNSQSSVAFDELGSPLAYNPSTQNLSALSGPGTIQMQSGGLTMTITIEAYTGEMSVTRP